jgi:methylated-DNA-[protein]-cysteine S-methyltransferase
MTTQTLCARWLDTPLGRLRIAASSRGLIRVGFEGQRHAPPQDAFPMGDSPVLDAAERQLTEYFAGERTTFDLPLDPQGTAYQQRVWQALSDIPFGQSTTYRRIAGKLGSVARAVGAANGQNPVSLVVPCHRVVGADGSLTGYAGGLDRKRWLLRHEGVSVPEQPSLEGIV